MHEVFETKPIIVAAIIGGIIFYVWNLISEDDYSITALLVGAFIGAGVQVGVRAVGVS